MRMREVQGSERRLPVRLPGSQCTAGTACAAWLDAARAARDGPAAPRPWLGPPTGSVATRPPLPRHQPRSTARCTAASPSTWTTSHPSPCTATDRAPAAASGAPAVVPATVAPARRSPRRAGANASVPARG